MTPKPVAPAHLRLTPYDAIIHWHQERIAKDTPFIACQRIWAVPGQLWDGGNGGAYEIKGLECERDGVVLPISLGLSGDASDQFFAVDRNSGLAATYRNDYPTPGRPDSMFAEVVQSFDVGSPCRLETARIGDVDGDGREDAVVLSNDCPDGGGRELRIFCGDVGGLDPLVVTDVRGDEVATLQLFDRDGDGQDEVLYLPLALGQFDDGPELEVLVQTADGLSAVSGESGVVGVLSEQTNSYAAFDLNADGLADVAVTDGVAVAVFLSDP